MHRAVACCSQRGRTRGEDLGIQLKFGDGAPIAKIVTRFHLSFLSIPLHNVTSTRRVFHPDQCKARCSVFSVHEADQRCFLPDQVRLFSRGMQFFYTLLGYLAKTLLSF